MTEDLRSAPPPPPDPGRDHIRGPERAPLVMFYGDFTCPRCALAFRRIREGPPVRLLFRHFALRAKHPRALALAHAVEAAACQDAFWELHDRLYEQSGRDEDPDLWEHCRVLGLELGRWDQDRRSAAVAMRVRDDVLGGMRAGVSVTPTLIHGGRLHAGPPASMREIFGK